MLVLSRRKGEAIQISDNIVITITEIKGGRVRLSVDAPRSVPVLRSEVLDRPRSRTIPDAALVSTCGGHEFQI